jgi:hypothetical protein
MEKIGRNNYEIFFIDYLDGNLPIEEIDLLLDFLSDNPDLAEELKDLEKIKIQPSASAGFNTQQLKKSDFDLPEIFEETCIRSIENDLSTDEESDFQKYLHQNDYLKKEYETYRLTISEPDPFILYDKKTSLKKKENIPVLKYWYSVAAIIILGLILFLPSDQLPVPVNHTLIVKSVETKISIPAELKNQAPKITVVESKGYSSQITKIEEVQEITRKETEKALILEPMKPMLNNLQIASNFNVNMNLARFETTSAKYLKDYSKYLTIEEFLAQKVDGIKEKEKNGFFGKLALNTLKKVTGKKFDYTTTKGGKINKFEFNSKLLAFSIPVNPPEN